MTSSAASCLSEAKGPATAHRTRRPQPSFTTPAGRATLGGTKDPEQTPISLWRTREGYAASSLAPGSFANHGQSERSQLTPKPGHASVRSHKSAWAPPGDERNELNPANSRPSTPHRGADSTRARTTLTAPTAS